MKVKGNTLINDNVFLSAAQIVMQEMDEVVKKDRKRPFSGISRIFAEKSPAQILVKKAEPGEGEEFGKVSYDLKLEVYYGAKIPVLVEEIRRQLTQAIQDMTGYTVETVDITVEKVVEPGETEEEEEVREG